MRHVVSPPDRIGYPAVTEPDLRKRRPRHHAIPAVRAASKVPEITAYFWIVKALTTAMGESASDFLVHALPPIVAVLLGFIAFTAALAIQLRTERYRAWPYWTAVAMVGVFGTMVADALHVGIGVPYVVSTICFSAVLACVFITWYRSERTLSIHAITTTRRELFYWAAVVATFALGTAVGDLTATTLHLGYLGSAVLFAAAIAVPAIGYRWFGLNAVTAFWSAYVLTRPLGASVADWLALPPYRGGLDLGSGPVALALAVVIAGFVAFLAVTKVDTPSGALH
jgi:uncharacterized membrane-anchored protein